MSNSQNLKKEEVELKNELGLLHNTLTQKKKEYKQLSKCGDENKHHGGAKKPSKKPSKTPSKKPSKTPSNKSSKKPSKKPSKKDMLGGLKKDSTQKRSLPPALVESQKTNKKISLMCDYKISPGLIKYVSNFRNEAKKTVKDLTDYMAVNKKTLEIFNEYFIKVGKPKVVAEIQKLAEQIRDSRKKKNK
jgi:hypothetical protein